MSAIGIITNTITWFELQPERTKHRVKRDDLDTLTEIYVGPSAYEDLFVPVVGSQHANYTLMRVINTSVKRLPAAMTEITVNYQGKLANGASYTSVPTVSKNWMEGEVSYQTNGLQGGSQAINFAGTTKYLNTTIGGLVTWTRRYTGRCVALEYITNQVPTGEPTRAGEALGFLGFENIWDTISGISIGVALYGGGGVVSKMTCTDVRVEDRADGWYKVTETYQSRMFPGPAGYQYTPLHLDQSQPNTSAITGTARNKIIDSPTQPAENADQQAKDPSQLAFWEQGNPLGTAQKTAANAGTTVAVSLQGSVGASTYQSTGMDPAYGQTVNYNDGQGGSAADIYPMISNDSSAPATPDVGTVSQVYSG